MTIQLGEIVLFYLGLSLVWIGLNWLYRDLVVDFFRQKIFTLRDSLFDEAADGFIDFSHPAYTMLRSTMNGFLRFGHKVSIFEMVIYTLLSKDIKNESYFEKRWTKATLNVDESTKNKLERYRIKITTIVSVQLILSSPLVFVFLIIPSIVLVVPALVIWTAKNKIIDFMTIKFEKGISSVESVALIYGRH